MTTLLVFAQTTLLFKVTSFDNWFPSSNLAESQNDAAFPGRKKEARIRKSNNKKTKHKTKIRIQEELLKTYGVRSQLLHAQSVRLNVQDWMGQHLGWSGTIKHQVLRKTSPPLMPLTVTEKLQVNGEFVTREKQAKN